ncbi:hypothetical protein [Rhodoferax saidenbachensis]|uniref:Uncharacterized protein n=1 Tax=Rhodoferax saidenbachensis TaxID=1484693 RepID=A0ABU1ZM10_9BURK|nr:hypothetical protein [Rhodoferax saidenbachensis]MDR7306576.1 hypothetical protein [Rhodoferax saidenbachensis]
MGSHVLEKLRKANIGTVLGLAGFGVVVVIGLTIPLWLFTITSAPQSNPSIQCQSQQAATKTLVGTLRRAGSSFYIQEQSWHFIAPACSGKPSSNCVMTEHAQMLDRTVGQTISAGYCANEVVFYKVHGVTYFR